MDHYARLRDLLEARLTLEHDQCPVALRREQGRGSRDLGGDVLGLPLGGGRQQPGQRADTADPLERPAQLRLEYDHEGKDADDRSGLENLGQQTQAQRLGCRIDEEQDADADHQSYGASPADQAEQPVDEECGDPDVDQRGRSNLIQDRLQ